MVSASMTVYQQGSLTVNGINDVECIGSELSALVNVMHTNVIIIYFTLCIEN